VLFLTNSQSVLTLIFLRHQYFSNRCASASFNRYLDGSHSTCVALKVSAWPSGNAGLFGNELITAFSYFQISSISSKANIPLLCLLRIVLLRCHDHSLLFFLYLCMKGEYFLWSLQLVHLFAKLPQPGDNNGTFKDLGVCLLTPLTTPRYFDKCLTQGHNKRNCWLDLDTISYF